MTAASAHYEPEQFETVAEVEVDSRGRVSLGKAGAKPGRSIPEREMIVWRNPELASEIRDALAESERGETADLGSFAEFDSDDEDED